MSSLLADKEIKEAVDIDVEVEEQIKQTNEEHEPSSDHKDTKERVKLIRFVKLDFENETPEDIEAEPAKPKKKKRERPGLCPDCGKTVKRLRAHRRFKHTKTEKTYTCQLCGEKITTWNYSIYFRHKQECEAKLPENADRYVCPDCGQKFSTLYDFSPHWQKCSGRLELRRQREKGKYKYAPYKCEYENCGYKHRNEAGLKNHINVVHLNLPKIKDFACDVCGNLFTQKHGLANHKKSVHGETRDHQCNECGMNFKTIEHLRRHLKVHSDVLGYTCPFCGKGFKQSATLYRHKLSCALNPDGKKGKVSK